MARRDALSAAGLAVLAVVYLGANRQYALDTLATPGPGVFPLAVGLLALGLAVSQAVVAMRAGPGAGPVDRAPRDGPARSHVPALVAVLVAFAIAVGVVGFLTTSFVLVLVASRLLGARDWLRPAILAAGVTAAAYVIFVAWLGVPLPKGLLP